MITDEQAAMLRVISDAMNERLAGVSQTLTFPAPQITNKVMTPEVHVENKVLTPNVHVTNDVATPDVHVTVDMAPVADALNRLADMFGELAVAMAGMAARPVEVSPVVNVAAPEVTVEQPAKSERPKRRIKITHGDGSTSVIQEE